MKITKWEVLSRILLILTASAFAYAAEDYNRQVLNTVGLSVTFIITIHLHKHFFPLFVGSIFFWLLASSQELYNQEYAYLPMTKMLWTFGNILLPCGIIDFLYRLIFKYQIIEK